jgi:hypothetical protein
LTIKQKFEVRNQIDNFRDRRTNAGSPQEIEAITDEQTVAEANMTVRHRTELRALRNAQAAEIAANGGRDPDQFANLGREIRDMSLNMAQSRVWVMRQWQNLEHRNHFIARMEAVRTRARNILTIPHITAVIVVRLEAVIAHATISLDEFMARAMQDAENGGVVQGWGGEAVPVVPAAQRLGAVVMALPNPNVLARIANDNQNVHTQLVVEQTKKNVAEILKIPVPVDYRWQRNTLSMTYKTIILFCRLSPKSTWQFTSMYCSDATIYDLEPGIFGKVVDGVWQFISKSPHKQDLKKILTSELRDNIGMCAQGNLSRICNVLQGYLEGIGQKESISEILGREFPKLMEIENELERLNKGKLILFNNNVPDSQWEAWLEPLRA